MNNLIYKIKNKLFRFSKESLKIKRPTYDELTKYKSFNRVSDNKFILSFGAGRCGQNWFAKIFNSHSNWIGTCERFADLEAFYRFISYYNLPIDKESFFKIIELASKRDMAKYKNTLIGSPYFSFGLEQLCRRLNPNYLFFHLRSPILSVESFHRKGWYLNSNKFLSNKIPRIDLSINLHRNFSRIIPNNDYFNEWIKLTEIGKITWFWASINKAIINDFNKIDNIEKFIFKLEDIDQNYEFYLRICSKFKFDNVMNKREFYNVINKAPNKGPIDKYRYKDWNNLEKKEFQYIIDKIFPNYENIKTTI
jgi:hypothetical protein